MLFVCTTSVVASYAAVPEWREEVNKIVGLTPSGVIAVQSEPEGASVLLNGTEIGETPLITREETGDYELRVELNDYVPVTREITVSNNERLDFSFDLRELYPDPYGNFSEYKSKLYGYEFKYPESYTLDREFGEESIVNLNSQDHNLRQLIRTESENLRMESELIYDYQELDTDFQTLFEINLNLASGSESNQNKNLIFGLNSDIDNDSEKSEVSTFSIKNVLEIDNLRKYVSENKSELKELSFLLVSDDPRIQYRGQIEVSDLETVSDEELADSILNAAYVANSIDYKPDQDLNNPDTKVEIGKRSELPVTDKVNDFEIDEDTRQLIIKKLINNGSEIESESIIAPFRIVHDKSLDNNWAVVEDKYRRLVLVHHSGEYFKVLTTNFDNDEIEANPQYNVYLSPDGKYLSFDRGWITLECDSIECIPNILSNEAAETRGLKNEYVIMDTETNSQFSYDSPERFSGLFEWSAEGDYGFKFERSDTQLILRSFDLSAINDAETSKDIVQEFRLDPEVAPVDGYTPQFSMNNPREGVMRFNEIEEIWTVELTSTDSETGLGTVERNQKLTDIEFATYQFPVQVQDKVIFQRSPDYYDLRTNSLKSLPVDGTSVRTRISEDLFVLSDYDYMTGEQSEKYTWNLKTGEVTEVDL
jgi:hypothetical protein